MKLNFEQININKKNLFRDTTPINKSNNKTIDMYHHQKKYSSYDFNLNIPQKGTNIKKRNKRTNSFQSFALNNNYNNNNNSNMDNIESLNFITHNNLHNKNNIDYHNTENRKYNNNISKNNFSP